jgi:hypothetical protein
MAVVDRVRSSTRAALDEAERTLVAALGGGDMAPFLGHHQLPTQVAHQLRDEIRRGLGRREKRLRLLFYFWPALTTAWIAQTVAERYGTIAQMELYPHLSELLGVPNLDPNGRARIAKLFRHACTRLDLPLPEESEAVDAYVVQAGVPHAQIDRLADVLAKAEQRVGLPDIDDDLAVAMFTDVAASVVDAGHPRLRKVLEHDNVGWYARLWTMLREHPEDVPDDAFVRLLADAANAGGKARSGSLKRPCLAWRDGLLSVEIPEGGSRRWTLTTEGSRQDVVGQAVPVMVPLRIPWPPIVEWQVGSLVRRRVETGSLEPPAREWVAIFAATGRLVARARFALPDELMQPVRLARGAYDLVSSTRFMGPERVETSSVPGGWHLRIEIGGEVLTLLRGSRSVNLAAVQRPELELLGSALRDLHGRAIYGDRDLGVRIVWPQTEQYVSDVDEEPSNARLHGLNSPSEPTHELLVEIPGKQPMPLPIERSPGGRAVIDLGRHLGGIEPTVRRLVLKLVRRGERRSLARTAAFVWIGLERLDGRRFAGRRPANLSLAECLHLDIRKDWVALPTEGSYATARLVVDDIDGKTRREAFEFAYPGLLAILRWLDPNGVRREQVLERDAVIALRPGDTRLLEVSSPDCGATLLIGAEVRPYAFGHRPRVGIPLPTVADACRGGADLVAVRGTDGIEITLARFTIPCDVTRWVESTDSSSGDRVLFLGFHEPLDRMRVRARDLWHDRTATLELVPDGLRRRDAAGIALRLGVDPSGPEHRARLVAELHEWPQGLWLCELEARLGTDPRCRRFATFAGIPSPGLCHTTFIRSSPATWPAI